MNNSLMNTSSVTLGTFRTGTSLDNYLNHYQGNPEYNVWVSDYSRMQAMPWTQVTVANSPVRMDMKTVAKTANVLTRLQQIRSTHNSLGLMVPKNVDEMITRIESHCEDTIEVDDSLWTLLGCRL